LGLGVMALGLAPVFLGACATKIYQGPTSGRGAEQQQAVTRSAERALDAFNAKPFRGQKVAVEVYGLTPRVEGESPEEAFLRSLLTERLLEAGASVADSREKADVLLNATLRTVGVDVIRRDFPAIYHHTSFRGVTSVRLSTVGLEGDRAVRTIGVQELEAESTYTEIYIFYIFGPIQSVETTLTRGGSVESEEE
jgi:hypothetical protein